MKKYHYTVEKLDTGFVITDKTTGKKSGCSQTSLNEAMTSGMITTIKSACDELQPGQSVEISLAVDTL